MERDFLNWYKKNETRFCHGQFDEKQIAYSSWLEGKKQIKHIPMQKCPKCNQSLNHKTKLK